MATGEQHIDTAQTRVTTWTIEPGDHIPMHVHEHDYVVVPLVDNEMVVVQADGTELVAELRIGVPYSRQAGAEHRVENRSDALVAFTEVEFVSGS